MDKLHDIALGIIVGAAVGDALGAPLEFLLPRNRDNWVVDMIGGGVLKWKPGETTDDTAMSLAIAEMYIEKKAYHQGTVLAKWEAWGNPRPKDMGNWTHKALSKWAQYRDRSRDLRGSENPAVILLTQNPGSAGNGAVMRCMPTAVARFNDEDLLVKETTWLAEDTHPDPRCIVSCLVLNKLLRWAFDGLSKSEALDRITAEIKQLPNLEYWDVVDSAKTHPWEKWDNKGYTLDTVKCALAAWAQNDSFEEGLIKVVNRGNDADTVGAVAGSLLGAYHGFESIPQRWWDALGETMKNRLVSNANALLEVGETYGQQTKRS